jgi:hypothetical protein
MVAQLVKKIPAFVEPGGSLLDPVVSQMNPVHTLTCYFFKINFNIIQ